MDARQKLESISQGYRESIVLLTASKAGIFSELADHQERGMTASELSNSLGLATRALETVLLALTSEGILQAEESTWRFTIAPEFLPLLDPNSPTTIASILNHNHACLQRWARLDETLVTDAPPDPSVAKNDAPQTEKTDGSTRDFILGMENISRLSSAEAAEKFDLSPYRKMLDLGGGPGTAAITFARANPKLRAIVLDLPAPVEIAEEQIAKAGLQDRVATRAGDFLRDDFGDLDGEAFDLVYISNIIHMLGAEDARRLIEKSHAALADGGTIVIKEFYLDDTRTRPRIAAYFSINMLVGTKAGKSYTQTETEELLTRAGFGHFRKIDIGVASALLIAQKTGA